MLSIAKFDTILFVSALILFQLFNIPITEANNVPTSWYTMIYWTTLFFSSVISGMMIAVILMLYGTVTNIIHIVGLGKNHYLVQDNKDNDEDEHS